MGKQIKRDLERDEKICSDYKLKLRGQYVLRAWEIELIYEISPARLSQILRRNGVKLRKEEKRKYKKRKGVK